MLPERELRLPVLAVNGASLLFVEGGGGFGDRVTRIRTETQPDYSELGARPADCSPG